MKKTNIRKILNQKQKMKKTNIRKIKNQKEKMKKKKHDESPEPRI